MSYSRFICLEEDCGAWQDFDTPGVVKTELTGGLLHKTYYFNRIMYKTDVVISIPTLKTSSGVVVTGGIKNVSIGYLNLLRENTEAGDLDAIRVKGAYADELRKTGARR